MMRRSLLFAAVLLLLDYARCQHWVNPHFECHRLDLRDLGYPEVNQIPANSSAITALLAVPNGKVYGGTSGEAAYLFVYDPLINKVRHLGKVLGQESIHHALVRDNRGFLYLGTGKNVFQPVDLTKNIAPGSHGVDNTLWSDIKAVYSSYEGGHLYRYDPSSDAKILLSNDACPLEDLGIPVAGNGIYALGISADSAMIYGISYPDGHLFRYTVSERKFQDLGPLDDEVIFHGPERDWRSLPRALVCDGAGNVHTSGRGGYLVSYHPKVGKIQPSGQKIPGEYYPVQAYSGHPVVEYFAQTQDGLIYGGSSDGYLFSLDNGKIVNLGKPRLSRRLRALTISRDGIVYMVAGERDEPGRLFSFDPRGGGFRDLGVMAVDRSPYYSWRAYQFDSMATGADGTVYLGESERRSHLFLYIP